MKIITAYAGETIERVADWNKHSSDMST